MLKANNQHLVTAADVLKLVILIDIEDTEAKIESLQARIAAG